MKQMGHSNGSPSLDKSARDGNRRSEDESIIVEAVTNDKASNSSSSCVLRSMQGAIVVALLDNISVRDAE